MSTEAANAIIEVDADELPISCPGPQTPLWNMHPKVFLDVATTGSAKCPYCGAEYRLKGGAKASH
ncbi:MAG: zinc-finger domain-containing protein [Pigmentiphaga sp.]|uniref:zinc-finger domain-containing protein n=1 Tax=Pigmentiphaga sp. TaxID=1977564 RepID=UPI0029AD8A10|nr:zinc-finger domain-containing protein [Pigmentiphaga sp.]MDX3906672.1 zinc-finger domain-containing protein [Pigmentiphaga sp.]